MPLYYIPENETILNIKAYETIYLASYRNSGPHNDWRRKYLFCRGILYLITRLTPKGKENYFQWNIIDSKNNVNNKKGFVSTPCSYAIRKSAITISTKNSYYIFTNIQELTHFLPPKLVY